MATESENPVPISTPSPSPVSTHKTESKKQEKKTKIEAIYPKYAGYSCPVCGSKRLTDDSGKYICPVTPKPSDCPVE